MAGRHERRTSATAPDDLDPQVQALGDCSRLYVKLEVSIFEIPQLIWTLQSLLPQNRNLTEVTKSGLVSPTFRTVSGKTTEIGAVVRKVLIPKRKKLAS